MIKKVGLGTAQWGMDYGINNITGKAKLKDIERIINHASKNSIETIDTAYLYGESEAVLGNFNLDNFSVITKTNKFESNEINNFDVSLLEKNFYTSLNNLKIDTVYGVLIHRGSDILKKNGLRLIEKLKDFKEKGLIKKIGVSIYNVVEIEEILEIFIPEIVQIPINVFSQDFLNTGMIAKLKSLNVEIHARSIFLQGLLLMKKEDIPPFFLKWDGAFIRWDQFCKENKLSKMQAAFDFVKTINYIDKVILGFDQYNQFIDFINNINLIKKDSKDINYSDLHVEDQYLCNPLYWKI